jgi:ABC-2 type transport system ATP-binding protein
MDEAQTLCDRVGIVDQGRVIASGTPGDLIAGLGAGHVVEVGLEAAADLDAIRALPGVTGARATGRRLSVNALEAHLAIPALLAELSRQGLALSEFATHHATLEDVFVALTGRHLRDD